MDLDLRRLEYELKSLDIDTRSHANPNVTATFTSTTTGNLTIQTASREDRTNIPVLVRISFKKSTVSETVS